MWKTFGQLFGSKMKEAKIQVHSLADSKCQTLICVSLDDLTVDRIKSLAQSTLAEWIAQTDYTMYNAIITNLLLPNLLKPIPQILTQQIRNFAKCINRWMVNALHGYSGKILSIWQLGKMNKTLHFPDKFIQLKTAAVNSMSHLLRRYTSLNHLATAACAVLKNQQQVNQMISDLSKVDFKNVQVKLILFSTKYVFIVIFLF